MDFRIIFADLVRSYGDVLPLFGVQELGASFAVHGHLRNGSFVGTFVVSEDHCYFAPVRQLAHSSSDSLSSEPSSLTMRDRQSSIREGVGTSGCLDEVGACPPFPGVEQGASSRDAGEDAEVSLRKSPIRVVAL